MRDGGGGSIFVQAQYCLGLTGEIKTFLTLSCQNRPVFTKGCFQLDLHTTSTVHCTQTSDIEICCDCEYERLWVDPAQSTGCSAREEPREGGVLWSHDKILSLLFIYSSSGSHCSQGPITLWITVDLSPCGHMVCSSHRAEYIWKILTSCTVAFSRPVAVSWTSCSHESESRSWHSCSASSNAWKISLLNCELWEKEDKLRGKKCKMNGLKYKQEIIKVSLWMHKSFCVFRNINHRDGIFCSQN